MAALYSPEWSEQLRSLYESIAGVTLDPWWDLYALLHYDDSGPKWIRSQVAGRRPVDVAGMTSRVEVAIETALRRLGYRGQAPPNCLDRVIVDHREQPARAVRRPRCGGQPRRARPRVNAASSASAARPSSAVMRRANPYAVDPYSS